MKWAQTFTKGTYHFSLVTGDKFFSERADAGQIPVSLVVVESVADHELILDFEAEIVGIDGPRPLFLFTQEHANANAARLRRFQFLPDGGQSVTAIEDVIQDQNMSILHVWQGDLLKDDFATRLRLAVITGHAQTIEPQWQWNTPHQIGHENETPVQDGDDGEFFSAVIFRDLGRDFVQPPEDCRFIKQHPLKIVLHCLILGHYHS